MKNAIFDLSLNNQSLYAGCKIAEVGGRLALLDDLQQASNQVGRNAYKMIDDLVKSGVEEITLSGAMAIWAYLIVFHCAVHRFRRVYYQDGKAGAPALIAAH